MHLHGPTPSLHITKPFRAYVAEAQATSFDMILGQDFNIALGIDVIINTHRVMTWMGHKVPFRVVVQPNHRFKEMQQAYIASFSPEEEAFEPSYCNIAKILAVKYDAANVDAVADAQHHLMPKQRHKLKLLLKQ
jgi:hypothetical protein